MNTDLLHKEITEKVIGAAFDVHSFLGNGFHGPPMREVIYQRALAYEMSQRNLEFAREIELLKSISSRGRFIDQFWLKESNLQ